MPQEAMTLRTFSTYSGSSAPDARDRVDALVGETGTDQGELPRRPPDPTGRRDSSALLDSVIAPACGSGDTGVRGPTDTPATPLALGADPRDGLTAPPGRADDEHVRQGRG